MNIVLTNLLMGGLSGTEQHARALALALLARGHVVAVYSPSGKNDPVIGRSERLRVCRTLDEVGFEPDVLHCHHLPCAIDAVLRWPRTPALFVVHDATEWHDALPPVEAFDLVAAVDQHCADRVAREAPGVRARIVPNPIEQDRIGVRRRGPKPRSLLIYGKSAGSSSWNRSIQAAALANGIWRFRTVSGERDPLRRIGHYDIILSRARSAMEACLSGAYTILFDRGLCGGAVTPENVEHLLKWNFGRGVFDETMTHRRFNELILLYSADSALGATRILKPLVDPDSVAASFESLYRRCISIRSERSQLESSLREKLEFARGLAQAMTRERQKFPSSRGFFRASPSVTTDPVGSQGA